VKNYGQEEFDLNNWSHMHTYSKEKYEKMGDLQTLTEQESVPFQYYDVQRIILDMILIILKAN